MSNFKYGRKPPTNAPALQLSSFLRSAQIPAHPAIADYGQVINDWQVLGNDQYGDCVAVAWANNRYLVTKYLGDTGYYPDQDQVYAFYKTQNPDFPRQDDGMVIQDALNYLRKSGGPDGVKAVAFAKVDTSNIEELRAASAIFGSIIYGINVTAANEDEFDANQAWDYVSRSQVLGGHGIVGVGYDPDIRFVTWGQETEFTPAFIQHQMEEAWVVIYPEHLGTKAFQEGVDVGALAADFKALTGSTLPIPEPTPTPTPDPDPTPTPGAAPFPGADPGVAALVGQAAELAGVSVTDWLNRHFKSAFGLS